MLVGLARCGLFSVSGSHDMIRKTLSHFKITAHADGGSVLIGTEACAGLQGHDGLRLPERGGPAEQVSIWVSKCPGFLGASDRSSS